MHSVMSVGMILSLLALNLFYKLIFTADLIYKVKSFRCTASNQTISDDFECFAKTYHLGYSSINFQINLTRPILTAMVRSIEFFFYLNCFWIHLSKGHFDLQLKKESRYTSIINTTIPICSFLNGSEGNVALKWVLDLHRETLPPGFIHACPYIGIFAAYNLTIIPSPWMPQFYTGEFMSSLRIFDDDDDNIFTFLSENHVSYSMRNKRRKKN